MDNDVSQVIDRTDLIENLLNQIIEKFLSPRKEVFPFFWNVFLDGSMISLGTKVRLVILIAKEIEFKINQESIRRVINLRNAFAHHGLQSHPTYIVGKTPDEDKQSYQLQVITSSLKIKKISRVEALDEFNKYYDSAKKTLVEMIKALNNNLLLEK
jgi:hypothetical protein